MLQMLKLAKQLWSHGGDLMLFSSCSHLLVVVVGCSLEWEQRGQSLGCSRPCPTKSILADNTCAIFRDNHDLFRVSHVHLSSCEKSR